MITVKDEATPFLAKMLERAENKTKLLTYVRKYSGDLAQRLYQEKIKQTPFAPSSLKRGRIPGTFDFVTGRLFRSIFESRITGSQLQYGSDVPYAIYQDVILKEKGPITDGVRQGLIAFSQEDEENMAQVALDYVMGDPLLFRRLGGDD